MRFVLPIFTTVIVGYLTSLQTDGELIRQLMLGLSSDGQLGLYLERS